MISRSRLAATIALLVACGVLSVFGEARAYGRTVWDGTQVALMVAAAVALLAAFGVIAGART